MKDTIKKQFLTGLVALLPAVVTLWLAWHIFKLIARILSPVIMRIPLLYDRPVAVGLISFVSVMIIIWLIGVITDNIVMKRVLRVPELVLMKMPFINGIYRGTKQIVDTVMVSGTAFRRVVLLEYPRKGVYSIGFVTNTIKDSLHQRVKSEKKLVVFIPSVPNPTTGYFVIVPEKETVALDISVEEGMKLSVSGGIVMPEKFELKLKKEGTSEKGE